MSIKENIEYFKRRQQSEKDQKEKDAQELDQLIHIELKNLIDKIGLEIESMGLTFNAVYCKKEYSAIGQWVLIISNGISNKTIEISPMYDDKKLNKLGDIFGVSYDGVCYIHEQRNLLRNLDKTQYILYENTL